MKLRIAGVALIVAGTVWSIGVSRRESSPAPLTPQPSERLSFNEHVQPILSDNCYQCHGLDANSREANLRLDREEFVFAPREDGPVIVRGDPDNSPLVRRIESTRDDEIMPPRDAHKELMPEEIAVLRRWVAEGAEYQEHWAFLAPQRPALPATATQVWGRNEIDVFVLARLEREGLLPSPEADKYTLLRRVTFDLTGLPPTPDEIVDFLEDDSPDAYERVVDRLLASPRWGEHRAHYWLDAARYGDTTGLHRDPFRLSWPYRDYVIKSFNENKPFDQFATEQIAGDLLPVETFDQMIATGFNRFHITQSTVGEVTEELRLYNTTDRVDTVSSLFLGLTASCASCHDHKFDPITQKDFYQLSAFFNNSMDPPFDNEQPTFFPTMALPPEGKEADAEAVLKQRAKVERELYERLARSDELLRAWISSDEAKKMEPISAEKLIARFRFDEGEGDTVFNSAPGADPASYTTLNEPPHWGDEAVRHWSSMRFSDSTLLPLGQLGDFDASDAFSVSGWFKPRIGRPQKTGSLVSKMDIAENDRGWDLFWDSGVEKGDPPGRYAPGRLMVNLIHDGADNAITVRAPQVISRFDWVHLAFTYDGSGKASGLRLFINGEPQEFEVIKDNLTGSIRTSAPLQLDRRTDQDELLGKSAINKTTLYETSFQDVRIYARRLGDGEIRGTMNRDVVADLLERPMESWNPDERKVVSDFYFREVDAKAIALASERARLDERLQEITEGGLEAYVMQERDSMAYALVLERGEYDQPKERVLADVPSFLPPLPENAPRNRLGLARWMFGGENPLTARVTVNRMWMELFGTGIVETPADFGVVGGRPSHPHLLDWLAVDFAENGWDVKRFYKQVVLSATYRQSPRVSPELRERDPDNRLLARGPRFRLSGEMIRDSALAAAGLLVEKGGGPSVNIYQPAGIWEALSMHNSKTKTHVQDTGDALYRRSVYTFWKRISAPVFFATFDAPEREVCVIQRERTNTPLQALVALNSPDMLEASRHVAARTLRHPDTSAGQKVDFMASLILTKPLPEAQKQVLLKSFDYFRETFTDSEAMEYLQVGDSPVDESLPAREHAAWAVVASQLLNTDQALNK